MSGRLFSSKDRTVQFLLLKPQAVRKFHPRLITNKYVSAIHVRVLNENFMK
jgi:hypothetical protein